MKSKLEG